MSTASVASCRVVKKRSTNLETTLDQGVIVTVEGVLTFDQAVRSGAIDLNMGTFIDPRTSCQCEELNRFVRSWSIPKLLSSRIHKRTFSFRSNEPLLKVSSICENKPFWSLCRVISIRSASFSNRDRSSFIDRASDSTRRLKEVIAIWKWPV